jgi:hypothetical protein
VERPTAVVEQRLTHHMGLTMSSPVLPSRKRSYTVVDITLDPPPPPSSSLCALALVVRVSTARVTRVA